MDMSMEMLNIMAAMPLLVLFLLSLVILTIKLVNKNKEPSSLVILAIVMVGLTLAAILSGFYGRISGADPALTHVFSNAIVFDRLSSLGITVIILITGATLVFARESVMIKGRQFSEFVFLLLNAAVGMFILVLSNDLIVTFVGIEVMSLCLYVLIAMSKEERKSKEAAFKYFIVGSFASAIFLYGVSFIFGAVGSTYFTDIAPVATDLITSNAFFLVGFIMILVGLLFKVAIVPFQAWAPDVYEGAPSPLTGFMSTGVKVVIFIVLLRLMATNVLLGENQESLSMVLQWMAVVTMFIGNILAIRQSNLKRMLAYSSIAHSGYALVGVIVAGLGTTAVLGSSGVLFYVIGYAVMTLGAFGMIHLFERKLETNITMDDFKGLGSRYPLAAGFFTLLLLSLAGIPPTLGFFGKFFVFSAALQEGLYWTVVWGVINSVIGVCYYLRPIVYMYMLEPQDIPVKMGRDTSLSSVLVGVLAILVVALGLGSQWIYGSVLPAVTSIFR